ncbi:hypothetical protein ACFFGL_13675, partial [Mesonia maritima]
MMRRILLLLVLIVASQAVKAQCNVNTGPTLCSDPANNVYIIDPTTDFDITFENASGNPIAFVNWSPNTFLYVSANQNFPLPNNGNNPTGNIYFNGNSHSNPSNPHPTAGANIHDIYTYNYTIPGSAGCSPTSGQLTIVTGGFTYDDFCRGDVTALNDISLLNYNSAGNLNWYSDDTGSTSIPGTTQIQGGQTYYVDLGIAGCSQVFPVDIEYATPTPEVELMQDFCTQATWQAAGFSNSGDDLSKVVVCGSNLQWYSDSAGTTPITNPSSVTLADGDVYYISQEINGCESALLPVTMTENECACIENPSFQDASGNVNLEGYTFFSKNFTGGISACQGMNYLSGTPQYTNTIQQYDFNNNNVAVTYATPANIPWLAANGVNISGTSPFGCSERSIKLNDDAAGLRTGTTMVKEFVAGEVISFDFLFLMNDPANHLPREKPFVTIRLIDQQGNLVQERCINADPDNCIFNLIPAATNPNGVIPITNPVVYTDWSCIKLNTIELQGQAARVEITTGDCDLTGHWGVGYFDNFYVGDDSPGLCDSAFGYMAVNPIDQPSGNYANCSLFGGTVGVNPNCAPALAANNVTFPIEICGTYSSPIGNPNGGDAPVTDITIDVVSNGTVVYSASTFTQPSPGEFCITINQSDISNPYGEFTIEGELEFTMNCGTPYNYYVQAQSNGFKFCPVAGCPTPFPPECNAGGNPNPISYDLTSRDSDILSNIPASEQGNYEITYYDDETGALTQD